MIKVIFFILIFYSCSTIKSEIKRYDFPREVEKRELNSSKVDKKEQENEKLAEIKDEESVDKIEQKTSLNFSKEINFLEELENFILNYNEIEFKDYLRKYDINRVYYSKNSNNVSKTLLITAVELQNLEIIKILLGQDNLHINQQNYEGKDALRYAIEKAASGGSVDIVEELLKRDDIFMNYDYFKIDGVSERKNLLNILEEGYSKKEKISLELYQLLENSDDEYEIEQLIRKGASLNYRYRYSNNAYMLRNFPKLAKDKNKIRLLFKYGIGKEIFSYELAHIIYSEKLSQYINLDYLKFIVEELKLNLGIKIKEEKTKSSYIVTTLLWEICNKISQQKDSYIKIELFKYIFSSNFIDLNQNDFKIFKNSSFETIPLTLKIIQDENLETILILLQNDKLDIDGIFNRYSINESNKILYNIFNKKGAEDQKIEVFDSLFKRGLSQKYLELEEEFLENIKENSSLVLKAIEIVKRHYPNMSY